MSDEKIKIIDLIGVIESIKVSKNIEISALADLLKRTVEEFHEFKKEMYAELENKSNDLEYAILIIKAIRKSIKLKRFDLVIEDSEGINKFLNR